MNKSKAAKLRKSNSKSTITGKRLNKNGAIVKGGKHITVTITNVGKYPYSKKGSFISLIKLVRMGILKHNEVYKS